MASGESRRTDGENKTKIPGIAQLRQPFNFAGSHLQPTGPRLLNDGRFRSLAETGKSREVGGVTTVHTVTIQPVTLNCLRTPFTPSTLAKKYRAAVVTPTALSRFSPTTLQ